jgi:hypothetical protein
MPLRAQPRIIAQEKGGGWVPAPAFGSSSLAGDRADHAGPGQSDTALEKRETGECYEHSQSLHAV